MKINISSDVFDSYFLRTGDVEPTLQDDGTLTVYDSDNGRSGNKWCRVQNTVLYNNDHLTSVLCSWHCRHSGSQFWRHYRDGQRVNWKSLDDAERMLILDAYDAEAPGWANAPGKLTRDYIKPRELQRLEQDEQGTIYGYKYLYRSDDGEFYSPRGHQSYHWQNGELEADREPTAINTNGIYAMKSRRNPGLSRYWKEGRCLVQLALSGTIVEANEGLRAQHAQIVTVLS